MTNGWGIPFLLGGAFMTNGWGIHMVGAFMTEMGGAVMAK